jgi:hypothetical protein
MTLASMPPAIVEADQRRQAVPISSNVYWAAQRFSDIPAWKTSAYSRVAALRPGRKIAGLGDLRPSDEAILELRKLLHKIQIQALPLPTVAPISGGAIFISWKSGLKSVETTVYHDGEILTEGFENKGLNEEISRKDLASMLAWLVQG